MEESPRGALGPGTVTLFEDSGGGLYLYHEGRTRIYDVTTVQGQASFKEDACALYNDDIEDWGVPGFEVTDEFMTDLDAVARYVALTDTVFVRDHLGAMVPASGIDHADLLRMGHAARTYTASPLF